MPEIKFPFYRKNLPGTHFWKFIAPGEWIEILRLNQVSINYSKGMNNPNYYDDLLEYHLGYLHATEEEFTDSYVEAFNIINPVCLNNN